MSTTEGNTGLQTVISQLKDSRPKQLARLLRYIRQPSVAATGEGIDDMITMLRDDIAELGGDGEIVPGDEYPIVHGRFDVGAANTVLIHTMYDVAPAEEAEWIVPPFDGKQQDWQDFGQCIVARGAEDTKSQVALVYNTIAAYRDAGVTLPVNVILVQEASELGSGSIAGFVDDHLRELQVADVVWWPLVTARPTGKPVMYLGAKGGVYGKLRCRSGAWGGPRTSEIHSMQSNWIANPAHRLAQALASLKDADQRILLEGFYGESQPPRADDEDLIDRLADDPDVEEYLLAITGAKRLRQDSLRQTLHDYCFTSELNISGLEAGAVIDGAHKCVIAPEATAALDIRLLESQTAADAVGALQRHLADSYPEVEWETLNHYEGARLPVDNWAVQAMIETYSDMGRTPEIWPTTAAAIANALWTKNLGVPWLMGAPAHASGKHSANEYIVVDTFYDAAEFGARLFARLASN